MDALEVADITFLGQILLDTQGQIPYASIHRKRVLSNTSCHKHLELRVFDKPQKTGNMGTPRDFKMQTRLRGLLKANLTEGMQLREKARMPRAIARRLCTGMNGHRDWGRSPHNQIGFFLRRSPDLWSGFFTVSTAYPGSSGL